ncbi:MAG: thiol-disulfide oxidoreductase DCC family protein [Acidimicrobiales bacterium]
MTAPTRSVLLYDGDCGFCTRSATFIGDRLAPPGQALPWQRVDLARYGLETDAVADASYWIDQHGRPHRGAAAITGALAAGTGGWSRVAWAFDRAPLSWLAAAVYPLVVRFRHRLPGSSDRCAVPPSESAGRP